MPEINVNGTTINYVGSEEIDPSRPTLLLIHGAGQRLATWRFQTGLLDDAGVNYVIPDLPGRGGSGGNGLLSIEEYKDFIKDFADALGLGELILAGHSMGGGVALNFALDYPEKVKALVLVGTGARASRYRGRRTLRHAGKCGAVQRRSGGFPCPEQVAAAAPS